MNKIHALAAAALALSSAQVLAQAKAFEGFSLGANVEADRSTVDATGGTSDSGTSTGLGLQAQYGWALSSNFVLGVGVSANTGNRKAGSFANGREAYVKDRYSFDLMPAVAASDRVLIFLRVSAVSASGASSDGTSTASLQGLGYGLGFRARIDNNLYWQAAYDATRFNDVTFSTGTVATYKGNIFSLGIGYRF